MTNNIKRENELFVKWCNKNNLNIKDYNNLTRYVNGILDKKEELQYKVVLLRNKQQLVVVDNKLLNLTNFVVYDTLENYFVDFNHKVNPEKDITWISKLSIQKFEYIKVND